MNVPQNADSLELPREVSTSDCLGRDLGSVSLDLAIINVLSQCHDDLPPIQVCLVEGIGRADLGCVLLHG
ncbi:MAG: hypothetical protein EAX95_10120 [Candidatus Thorarchaeota archaeon]|nr:hypothetical protein [Candidatus Thorarchaeota archaeon]